MTSDDFKRSPGGQFTAGTKAGPGRKPGRPDIYLLAERMARDRGVDLEDELWNLILQMLRQGIKGDTTAAKLALDHLALPAKQVLELQQRGVDEPQMTVEEIERRVASLLATAAARAEAAKALALKNGQNGANGQHRAPDA